jgi:WD40 repeat protein
MAIGRQVRFLDLDEQKTLTQLSGNLLRVDRLDLSRSGRWLVSPSFGEAVVWDLDHKVQTLRLSLPRKGGGAVALSPDGLWLAHGLKKSQQIRLVQPKDVKKERFLVGHATAITALCYSPDGSWLASGSQGGTIRLWNAAHWIPPARGTYY